MSRPFRRCRFGPAVLPFVDGELATDEALRFEEHLPGCESCRAAFDAQRALEEALVSLPRPKLLLPDRARLLAGIAERITAPVAARPVRPMLPRVAAGLAAAAALAIALFTLRPQREPEVVEVPGVADLPDVAAILETVPPVPPPPMPDPTISPTGSQNGALMVAARDEVARILRELPRSTNAIAKDDLLTSFLAAAQPLRAAGIPFSKSLSTLLPDPDPRLACVAAELIVRAAPDDELGRDVRALVPALESAMRRPDRGSAMLRALVAIGTPRAWDGVVRAVHMPHVRTLALRALAADGSPARLAELQAGLLESAPKPGGGRVVASVLAELEVDRPEHVELLAELVRRGVADAPIAAALARARTRVTELLVAALADRNDSKRRQALLLAPLAPPDSLEALAPALVAIIARGEQAGPASEVLARIGGGATLAALLEAGCDPALSNSRIRALAAAFSASLDATDDVASAITFVRGELPELGQPLVELSLIASGPNGAAARALLLGQDDLPRSSRARLALDIARRHERVDPAVAANLLAETSRQRAGGERDDGFTACLLVLLYAVDGEAGLERGVRALGLELPRARLLRLRDASRLVVTGPERGNQLAQVDAVLDSLHLAP